VRHTPGGQAVIEGVMMRTSSCLAVAVRRRGGEIVLSRSRLAPAGVKRPLLRRPFIRGVPNLLQSLVVGIQALNFSMVQALEEDEIEGGDAAALASGVLALCGGLLLFFYVPLLLTRGVELLVPGLGKGLAFNTVDGLFRLAVFVLYIFLISRWGEVRRVFAYHGAEHMAVSAYEHGRPLSVKTARDFSTVHARCGTSFLLVVMLVSILLFSLIPSGWPLWAKFFARIGLLPVLAGGAYEIVRWNAGATTSRLASLVSAPGRWLQQMTALPPDDGQIEVALVALEAVLQMEDRHGTS